MTTTLLTFADESFADWQRVCTLTAQVFGIHAIHAVSPSDIDARFARDNHDILTQPRGCGLWLWKPYFIDRMLRELDEGDVLIYADAAMHFVNPVSPIEAMLGHGKRELLLFGEGFRESQYTKRDAFVLLNADEPRYAQSPQRFASALALRNTGGVRELVAEWLHHARDPRILGDADNTCGLPNHSDFIAHRHDQSILSLLSKRFGFDVPVTPYLADGLPERGQQVLNHTRRDCSVAQIVSRLLADGVVSIRDLERFSDATPQGGLS